MSLFEQKSLLAKLMATENLHIQQSNVATASFDVLNRVLTVPVLDRSVSKDVYDLFMGHECGHALWTPLEGMKKAKTDKVNMSVLNIVEDSRIERRIKNKYPGIKTPFYNAYGILFNDNFFETEGKDLNEFNFIDRVNLHCKVGAVLTLPFTEEERQLLGEVESTDTWEEVVEVTKKICEFMKNDLIEKEVEKQKLKIAVLTDGGDEGDNSKSDKSDEKLEDFDIVVDARSGKGEEPSEGQEKTEEKSDSAENSDKEDDKPSQETEGQVAGGLSAGINMKEIEEQIRSFTDDAYKRNENNLFSKDGDKYLYVNVPKFDVSRIMDYKDMSRFIIDEGYTVNTKDFVNYRRESSTVVSYLVKEFELRKNADQLKRASVAKTGELNMNRLYSYQFTEDIFKKITVLPNGQSHGLVMFLDWSGSMINHIANTTKQVLNLTLFCKKVNIPFEVYCFIDGTKTEYMNNQKNIEGDLRLNSFGLINLLSSRMSNKDYTFCGAALMKMSGVGCFYRGGNRPPSFMYMSGTPLNEAIIAAMEIVPQFQKKNRLQIVNTVFLTDGEGASNTQVIKNGYAQSIPHSHMVIRDPKTRHEQIFERNTQFYNRQTDCLIRLLKVRTNSHVIGFFVGGAKDITNRVSYFYPEYNKLTEYGDREAFREKLKEEFRKNSSLVVTATGFDDYYLLRSSGLDTDGNAELDFSEKATTRGMASAFSKYAGNKIASRVVLNRFIELIS